MNRSVVNIVLDRNSLYRMILTKAAILCRVFILSQAYAVTTSVPDPRTSIKLSIPSKALPTN